MLIHVADQEKLDELWDLLGELPVDMKHTFHYGQFPMIAELWLNEAYDKTQIAVSFDGETLMPVGEWEKKIEAELHAKFGNPLDMKGER